jgi:CHAT domain-containing protein
LAALYDGKQWLTQRFAINNITALSLTDLGKTARPLKVLAAAYTEKGKPHSFQVGKTPFSFLGLRFAGTEVKNLVNLIPGTTQILDEAFSLDGILQRMRQYSIIHLATHAEFINGQPEQSFILLGNGDRVRFRDLEKPDRGIESWRLPNTDLVVLSACKTGVGEELGDGREILGFGYLIQQTSARASMSSLWSVDDGGTQALMDAFYAGLKQGMTKTQALQQAQIALITSQDQGTGSNRATLRVEIQNYPQTIRDTLSHPYYWAPFILIGNGL